MAVVRKWDDPAQHAAEIVSVPRRRVELGEVSLGTLCRVDVPVWDSGPRAGWHEQLDGAGSGFAGTFDVDVLAVTFAPEGPGAHAATLVVRDDRGPVLNVELSARVPGDLGLTKWPRTPTEPEAAEALEAWAAEQRFVPDWRSGADMTVRDASVVRATVLTQCEGVSTAARRASSLPDLPLAEGGDMRLEPRRWEHSSGDAIVGGSVDEHRVVGSAHGSWVAFRTITHVRTLAEDVKLSGDRRLAMAGRDDFRGVCWWANGFERQVPAQHHDLFAWVGEYAQQQRVNQVALRISVEVLPVTAFEYRVGRASRTAYLIGDGGTVWAPRAAWPSLSRVAKTLRRAATRRPHS